MAKLTNIVGLKIKAVRALTREELECLGWDFHLIEAGMVVIVLEDGTFLFPSQDEEGNGPGAIFARQRDDKRWNISYVDDEGNLR